MRDPFEVLRDAEATDVAPDVDEIKARARRIRQRPRIMAGAGAALAAVIAVLVSVNTVGRPTQVAIEQRQLATPASEADTAASIGAAPEGYVDTTDDEVAPPPEPDAIERGSTTTGAAGSADMSDKDPLAAKVTAESPVIGGVKVSLVVCNTTSETHTRSFGTAQRYDFVVTRAGAEVWRWSDDRAFAQAVGQQTWAGRECKTWKEEWDGTRSDGSRAPGGEYEIVGVLTANPELRSETTTFCYGIC